MVCRFSQREIESKVTSFRNLLLVQAGAGQSGLAGLAGALGVAAGAGVHHGGGQAAAAATLLANNALAAAAVVAHQVRANCLESLQWLFTKKKKIAVKPTSSPQLTYLANPGRILLVWHFQKLKQ